MDEDRVLYRRFLNGDEKSFDMIIYKYMEKLTYFAYGIVKRIDVAEDIAQDVFVYILMNKNTYNPEFSLKSYLYTIARSRAINYLKREKKISYLVDESYLFSEKDVEDVVFNNEENIMLKKSIDLLPEKQKRIIYLVDIEELSYREICEVLNMSLPQVKSLIHRSRKNLKKIMIKEEKVENER
ncbi:MAG: RNA polymerase sigma factor [Clostridia bacterium]|nr:RNA polymerase sigma factor [Clostridia bacterium]